ncbi:hypothetical protein [Cesiribacter andamanensis]|uniref:Uncharacterized protein n=1 Tax=Cesiribacter andamanensis AMV16 TaxID=1279009 RepID=M7N5Z0_9BACT|nr:hypothetical protein [Cesiribacter andamanensis]EMR02697.1 hypothetical protein ADICEAN_02174 [Cesiribacter andamanensis AMV16]
MHSFYRVAWNVLFTIFYPFITLFSLLFIGLVNVVSWISRQLATPHTEPGVEASPLLDWTPYLELPSATLSRKAVHEVQFGPMVYRLRSNPAVAGIQEGYWGDFAQSIGQGVLLQRWPSIAEHELERFELVYFSPASGRLDVLGEMPTFFWEADAQPDGSVRIYWNERSKSRTLRPEELA